MRVLSVGNMYPPHSYGGYEQVWHSAVEHLRARGIETAVLTTDVDTGAQEPDPPHVHRDLRWHLRGAEFLKLSPRERFALARHNHRVLDRHLAALRPDMVTWWSMGGLTLTLLEAVRRRGLPAVAFVHDDWLYYGPVVDPWLALFTGRRRGRVAPFVAPLARLPTAVDFGAAARYVFVSECTRRRALERARLDLPDTDVVHSGIDPAFLVDPPPDREWGWRLLYVGRIDPRKGVQTAVEALVHLPAEARLEIVGGGAAGEEERLRGVARHLGVADRVAFCGQRGRDGVIAAYDAADVTIFPVVWEEPWGLVPLESMARGRPVVATGRGGSEEYLGDGENCLLFEAEDAPALAAAVRRLAEDRDLRGRLRRKGLATAPLHTTDVLDHAVEEAVCRRLVSAG